MDVEGEFFGGEKEKEGDHDSKLDCDTVASLEPFQESTVASRLHLPRTGHYRKEGPVQHRDELSQARTAHLSFVLLQYAEHSEACLEIIEHALGIQPCKEGGRKDR
ncbi:hypothetical protein M5D96_009324 [Drosophila gunungcola]|uniref:Uncharacterized protein n=1 Tax=Drosophila gunungcola TaxID=103775 RepID=A0A9Q0BLJ5_9MUSC|nr:hypothetical protein M5D96_010453 [Drosophila gunungcola]KAI8037823.1 hypothetical protein M5D96_009324 [Drosophila gunungcola]